MSRRRAEGFTLMEVLAAVVFLGFGVWTLVEAIRG